MNTAFGCYARVPPSPCCVSGRRKVFGACAGCVPYMVSGLGWWSWSWLRWCPSACPWCREHTSRPARRRPSRRPPAEPPVWCWRHTGGCNFFSFYDTLYFYSNNFRANLVCSTLFKTQLDYNEGVDPSQGGSEEMGVTAKGLNTYDRVIFQFFFFNKFAKMSTFVFFY